MDFDKGLGDGWFLEFVNHPVVISLVPKSVIGIEILGNWCDLHTGSLASGVNAVCGEAMGKVKCKGLNFSTPGQDSK